MFFVISVVLFLLSSCEDSDSSSSDSGSTDPAASIASIMTAELLSKVESLSEEKGSLSDIATNLLDKSVLDGDALKAGSDALKVDGDILEAGIKEKISSINIELIDAAED